MRYQRARVVAVLTHQLAATIIDRRGRNVHVMDVQWRQPHRHSGIVEKSGPVGSDTNGRPWGGPIEKPPNMINVIPTDFPPVVAARRSKGPNPLCEPFVLPLGGGAGTNVQKALWKQLVSLGCVCREIGA